MREPTRGHTCSTLSSAIWTVLSTRVLPHIADHRAILVSVEFALPGSSAHSRELWDFARADWGGLCGALALHDWSWRGNAHPDVCAARVTELVLQTARRFIPVRSATCFRPSHPWLNERCIDLVRRKQAAEGLATFHEVVAECSRGMLEEFRAYIRKTRGRLRACRRGSKRWRCLPPYACASA